MKNLKTRNRRVVLAAIAGGFALASLGALAQPAPGATGRIVVPFTSGGPADILARILTDGYQRLLGATYVVENKPGATGDIGAGDVTRAKPDGATLLITNTAIVMNPHLFKQRKVVDPFQELSPVSAIGTTSFAVAVPATAPETNFADWLKRMRSKSQVNYGSFGIGSTNHLYAHDFSGKIGLETTHIPYKGDAQVAQGLIGGQLDFSFIAVGTAKRLASKLKVLAVTGDQRALLFPSVPTLAEVGVAGLETGGWLGLFAPAGTPIESRRRIATATTEILSSPAAREKLDAFGITVFGTTPEQFEEMTRTESVRQAARIKASGASLD